MTSQLAAERFITDTRSIREPTYEEAWFFAALEPKFKARHLASATHQALQRTRSFHMEYIPSIWCAYNRDAHGMHV